jgi:hypothetical protein
MSVEPDDIPGWIFEIDEVSAGVYKVTGKDAFGRSVEKLGFDRDAMLDDCKKYAAQFVKENEERR